jgi:hypothetical protein
VKLENPIAASCSFAPRHEIQHRRAEVRNVEAIVLFGDLHQARCIGERKRPNENGVDDAEHRRVDRDGERHGQHDRKRETRRTTDRAERVAEIFEQCFHLCPGDGGGHVANDVEPDARRRLMPRAVAEHLRHLAAVLGPEFSGIEPQQETVHALIGAISH